MDESATAEKCMKRDWRRAWFLLFGTILLMLGLVAYIVFVYDIDPPDDAWLLPKTFSPSSGPGSISHFVKTAGKFLEAANTERASLTDEERLVLAADLTKVRAYLLHHEEVLR